MTDKEIIDGLAHCFNMAEYSDCNDCPYRVTKGKRCTQALYDDVIGLINSQQEKIKRLTFIQHTDLIESIFTETVHKQMVIKEFVEELKKNTFHIMLAGNDYKVLTEQRIDYIAQRKGVTK